jgi:hypothetical protein
MGNKKSPKYWSWSSFNTGLAVSITFAIILGLIAAIGAIFNPSGQSESNKTKLPSRNFTINRKVTDNGVEINLYELHCGLNSYKDIVEKKPTGEFCVVDVNIVNRSKATTSVFPGDWALLVGDRQYKITDWNGQSFDDLLPDGSAEGTAAFDVNIGATPNGIIVDAGSYGGYKINF